jgi:hypothetical protein
MRCRRPSFGFLSLGFPLSAIQVGTSTSSLRFSKPTSGGDSPASPRPHPAGIAVAFEFVQENDDPSPRCGQLSRHDVPNEIEVHTEVVVSDLPRIPAISRHGTPGARSLNTGDTRFAASPTMSRFLTTASWIIGETKNSSRPDSVYASALSMASRMWSR